MICVRGVCDKCVMSGREKKVRRKGRDVEDR